MRATLLTVFAVKGYFLDFLATASNGCILVLLLSKDHNVGAGC